MYSDLVQDISDSIEDIKELLNLYDKLLSDVQQKQPDNVEVAALGAVLHSFYNGVEGIFSLVAKQIDGIVPNDLAWHQSLLKQVTEKTNNRKHLITQPTADLLAPYMRFRHFFRHAYAFMLDWHRMKPLVDSLCSVWDTVRSELELFTQDIE